MGWPLRRHPSPFEFPPSRAKYWPWWAALGLFAALQQPLAASAHDNFGSAQGVDALPFTDTENTSAFTREAGEPSPTRAQCSSSGINDPLPGRTAWYTYTPTRNERLVAHTSGSAINTVLAVYRAGAVDTLANLTLVACNDNAQIQTANAKKFFTTHSQLVFDAAANTKYYFQVGGRRGAGGDVSFSLGVLENAALFVTGVKGTTNDRTHLESALRKSPIWSHAVIAHIDVTTEAELQNAINETYAGVPATGISLFFYSGHGGKRNADTDPPADRPPVDEGANDGRDELLALTRDDLLDDDRIGPMFQRVTGRKVLVFNSCFAGGMIDGAADCRGDGRLVPGVFLASSQPDEASWMSGGWLPVPHVHGWFSGGLINGLSAAAPGRARADGAGGGAPDGQVTVREWFTFADAETRRLATLADEVQRPLEDDSRAPAGAGSADLVLFSYTLDRTTLLDHSPPAAIQELDEQCQQCCDFGDAPDPFQGTPGRYPTRRASTGAQHLDIEQEWLGGSVDDEDDADPERDGNDEDVDGEDGDRLDDGVRFRRVSASLVEIAVTVSVLDRHATLADGSPRYRSTDPEKRLYLNAWADWNGDGGWSSDEKIIGAGQGDFAIDPAEDTQFGSRNRGTYLFPVPMPPSAATTDFYFRFRLDYGEDVGEIARLNSTLHQERGTAQAGEVEDYCEIVPPRCEVVEVRDGPPTELDVAVQDLGSGLASIAIERNKNFSVDIPEFRPGTHDEITVTATRVNQSQSAVLQLRVTDRCGNVIVCDPVMTMVIRTAGAPVSQVFTGIPAEEHYIRVQNGRPGVTNLHVFVNGESFKLPGLKDGETMTLDVRDAMRAGNQNTIRLVALGAPGGSAMVIISN
jgi:hypothetical protein